MHELYGQPEVRDAVAARFGRGVLGPDGAVDRPALARAAFASDAGREWLERLLWPRVGERIAAWRAEQAGRRPVPRALVVEVPLLFESGSDHGFDATIAVITDERIRERRAGARGHAAIAEREARQLSQEEKSRRATYTVVNDGTPEQLATELSAILEKLQS